MGRLTADPELRYTPNNIAVATFTLAVDRGYVKQGSERVSDFIRVVCWRATAEFVSKYFHKGQLVALQGSIQTRNYTTNAGEKRYAVEVLADKVFFAEPKRDNQRDQQSAYHNPYPDYDQAGGAFMTPPPAPQPTYTPAPQAQPQFSSGDFSDFEILPGDDDLPF